MILTEENRRTRRKTCPNATLSIINPARTDPCANPGLRCTRPTTNFQSHDPALITSFLKLFRQADKAPLLRQKTTPSPWNSPYWRLKIRGKYFSETSIYTYQNTRIYISEEQILIFTAVRNCVAWLTETASLNKLLLILVRFQVSSAASMKLRIFWDVLPCS
jgi:hypothetical protein